MTLNDNDARSDQIRSLRNLFLSLNWFAYRQLIEYLQTHNLSPAQFFVLVALTQHGHPATMSELTEVTGQDAPSMTGVVNRLVKLGLVERTRDERDRRVVLVAVSPAGATMATEVRTHLESEDVHGFALLSNDDLASLERLLAHLLTACLRQIHDDPTFEIETAPTGLEDFAQDPIGFIRGLPSQCNPSSSMDKE